MADRSDDADGAASRADAVDRLERVIDTQIDTVDDFDQKAAYVTRFVGVALGLVLTAVSLASRFGGGIPPRSCRRSPPSPGASSVSWPPSRARS